MFTLGGGSEEGEEEGEEEVVPRVAVLPSFLALNFLPAGGTPEVYSNLFHTCQKQEIK